MIGCDGKRIYVGWAEHEILWLRAAMSATLNRKEKQEALQDIADMTGRSYANCCWQARRLAGFKERSDREEAQKQKPAVIALEPSVLNTSARMMAMRVGARA
jgi:hypothetical protein